MNATLIIEMRKRKVTQSMIAVVTGRCMNAICQKINGKQEFTQKEMFAIRDAFFPDMTLDQLFARD